jgi:hypothetical protein
MGDTMKQPQHGMADDATVQKIMTALRSCYGSLDEPNFRKVYATMDSDHYRQLVEALRSSGAEVTNTTDRNDDVSIHLVMDQAGDQIGLGLSGVGPFAALVHQDADGRYYWVTRPDDAPTPLAALVATAVQRAGFQLLDRATVTKKIRMCRADGTEEATLYQALFTDTDMIP